MDEDEDNEDDEHNEDNEDNYIVEWDERKCNQSEKRHTDLDCDDKVFQKVLEEKS